jgi:hypothetical protein
MPDPRAAEQALRCSDYDPCPAHGPKWRRGRHRICLRLLLLALILFPLRLPPPALGTEVIDVTWAPDGGECALRHFPAAEEADLAFRDRSQQQCVPPNPMTEIDWDARSLARIIYLYVHTISLCENPNPSCNLLWAHRLAWLGWAEDCTN